MPTYNESNFTATPKHCINLDVNKKVIMYVNEIQNSPQATAIMSDWVMSRIGGAL